MRASLMVQALVFQSRAFFAVKRLDHGSLLFWHGLPIAVTIWRARLDRICGSSLSWRKAAMPYKVSRCYLLTSKQIHRNLYKLQPMCWHDILQTAISSLDALALRSIATTSWQKIARTTAVWQWLYRRKDSIRGFSVGSRIFGRF